MLRCVGSVLNGRQLPLLCAWSPKYGLHMQWGTGEHGHTSKGVNTATTCYAHPIDLNYTIVYSEYSTARKGMLIATV